MSDELITVVLPIYNVEKYLDRCIKSVVGQSYRNLEIILVDDGSPDQCPQKCEEWAEKDNRIKVIHKQNAGLGMARNTGIENAHGEYICFFDSDDYIALDTIEKAYSLARKEEADMVCFGYTSVKTDGSIARTCVPSLRKYVFSNFEVQNEFLPELISESPETGVASKLNMSAWSCLYSTKLINKLQWRFVSEREVISEDIYSLLFLYKHVQKVAVLPEALYYYCENGASLTRTYRKDRYARIRHFYQMCLKANDELHYPERVSRRLVYPYLGNTIAAMKQISVADCSLHERIINISSIVDDEVLQNAMIQLKKNRCSMLRKLLFFAIRKQFHYMVFLLLRMKSR
ncbi:glycosyltransferase family 2 protein [Bacillus sp. X1(2014)]|uniref:glycosyltransferase n=1 Tax=Bacillus sp. X1(2014) TaxID=1565991 RepID=UPI0011AA38C9|nr:glycosyltransferase family 2 protein [Bacillus sp. X1(2014)]